MISTKGRYAMRMLVDIAEQGNNAKVTLRDVAARQEISEKYFQHVAKLMVDKGLLVGTSGRGGGYRLAHSPQSITVLKVLEAAEGTVSSVACLAPGAAPCPRAQVCKALPFGRATTPLQGSSLAV